MGKVKTNIVTVLPEIELKLFTNEEEYINFFSSLGVEIDMPNGDAMVTEATLKDGTVLYCVLLKELDIPYEKKLALLTHEAVHIAQLYFNEIGETNPGIEEEAYTVQGIAQCLFLEYRKVLGNG